METKIKVIALVTIVIAAMISGSIIAMQATVKANATEAVASDVTSTNSSINATNLNPFFTNGYMGFGGHGETARCFGGFGGPMLFSGNQSLAFAPGGVENIQVSSDFTQNVTNILNNSSDVKTLLNQGYNVTSIRPIITRSIDGNGNINTQATSANVTLQGTSGKALVVVSLSQEKVTKIVNVTVNNNPS